MKIDHDALLRAFLAEAEDGLAAMEEALLALERSPRDAEALGTVFRAAHSLKGNAEVFGFAAVAELSHAAEDLLDGLREHRQPVTGELITVLLRAVDALREMVPAAAAGSEEMPSEARSLRHLLSGLAAGEEGTPAAPSPAAEPPSIPPPAAGPATPTLRVDLGKLDRLLTLTGEIAIARGRVRQLLASPEAGKAEVLAVEEQADLLHKALRELVMELRMVPVGPAFRRYLRTVRDLARSHGKKARLAIVGEDVEVDATVVERLRDSLTHMVRNAVDHGLEPPEVRAAQGKDPCGVVTLRAAHEGGTIAIEVGDDGAGLDRDQIVQRAAALGLATGELSEREIDQLIFEPGFSTSETVTDLSGRGVGLEVVRAAVEALGGSVEVTSRPGKGTRIALRLPLTLAIMDGLLVRVGRDRYLIPLAAVVEVATFHPDEKLPARVLQLHDRRLPWVRLRDLLRLDGVPEARRESAIVVRYPGGEAALVVDGLDGEQQAVVKPLAKLFQGLPGITGSTILGDGRVALLLDVGTLLQETTDLPKEYSCGAD